MFDALQSDAVTTMETLSLEAVAHCERFRRRVSCAARGVARFRCIYEKVRSSVECKDGLL